jgi:hypothetical protein
MRRHAMPFRTDRRVFTRAAGNIHSVNFLFVSPMRGGIRL